MKNLSQLELFSFHFYLVVAFEASTVSLDTMCKGSASLATVSTSEVSGRQPMIEFTSSTVFGISPANEESVNIFESMDYF